MGKGTDLARAAGNVEHADLIDDLKDQLLIVFLRRLIGTEGRIEVDASEVDETGGYVVELALNDNVFTFVLRRKQ